MARAFYVEGGRRDCADERPAKGSLEEQEGPCRRAARHRRDRANERHAKGSLEELSSTRF